MGSDTAHNQGFSLMEVMLVVILLALAVAPLLESFRPSLNALNQAEQTTVFKQQALWTLNRVAALDYEVLEANSSGSGPVDLEILLGSTAEADEESFTHQGQSRTPVVRLSASNQDQGLGGLLEIEVSLGHVSLQTLKAEH